MSGPQKQNLLQCYKKSCGKQFDPDENEPDSCLHHPGEPVFHDVYKKWSCCEKRTTDFTDFLNIKGCTRSYHSGVKPEQPQKQLKSEVLLEDATTSVSPKISHSLPKPKPITRPSVDLPMVRLPSSVSSSLKTLLDKLPTTAESFSSAHGDDVAVALGTPCLNPGCKKTYQVEEPNALEECVYHSGAPIFHEGMKYWLCCQKKTSDFTNFLEQVGCTKGSHKWVKDTDKLGEVACRYDWHQTGSNVYISVYAKVPIPEDSFVEANPVKVNLQVTFGEKRQIFRKEIVLFGVVDVQKSDVSYVGTKVEIKLKKAEPMSWKDLAQGTKI